MFLAVVIVKILIELFLMFIIGRFLLGLLPGSTRGIVDQTFEKIISTLIVVYDYCDKIGQFHLGKWGELRWLFLPL